MEFTCLLVPFYLKAGHARITTVRVIALCFIWTCSVEFLKRPDFVKGTSHRMTLMRVQAEFHHICVDQSAFPILCEQETFPGCFRLRRSASVTLCSCGSIVYIDNLPNPLVRSELFVVFERYSLSHTIPDPMII